MGSDWVACCANTGEAKWSAVRSPQMASHGRARERRTADTRSRQSPDGEEVAEGNGIKWTQATWNPTAGCSIVSPGCTHCYAMRMAHRLQSNKRLRRNAYRGVTKKAKAGPVWTGRVNVAKSAEDKPIGWRKPRLIFVNSMSNVFHGSLTSAQIARIWAIMAIAKQHTYQVLTKRPERMLEWLLDPATRFTVELATRAIDADGKLEIWPLPNVWCGTSTED